MNTAQQLQAARHGQLHTVVLYNCDSTPRVPAYERLRVPIQKPTAPITSDENNISNCICGQVLVELRKHTRLNHAGQPTLSVTLENTDITRWTADITGFEMFKALANVMGLDADRISPVDTAMDVKMSGLFYKSNWLRNYLSAECGVSQDELDTLDQLQRGILTHCRNPVAHRGSGERCIPYDLFAQQVVNAKDLVTCEALRKFSVRLTAIGDVDAAALRDALDAAKQKIESAQSGKHINAGSNPCPRNAMCPACQFRT